MSHPALRFLNLSYKNSDWDSLEEARVNEGARKKIDVETLDLPRGNCVISKVHHHPYLCSRCHQTGSDEKPRNRHVSQGVSRSLSHMYIKAFISTGICEQSILRKANMNKLYSKLINF